MDAFLVIGQPPLQLVGFSVWCYLTFADRIVENCRANGYGQTQCPARLAAPFLLISRIFLGSPNNFSIYRPNVPAKSTSNNIRDATCVVSMSTQQRTTSKSLKRAACDRCHQIKNRCSREPGCRECERCTRLGITCNYSAPLRMGRPMVKDRTNSYPRSCVHQNKTKKVGRNGNRNGNGSDSGQRQKVPTGSNISQNEETAQAELLSGGDSIIIEGSGVTHSTSNNEAPSSPTNPRTRSSSTMTDPTVSRPRSLHGNETDEGIFS